MKIVLIITILWFIIRVHENNAMFVESNVHSILQSLGSAANYEYLYENNVEIAWSIQLNSNNIYI